MYTFVANANGTAVPVLPSAWPPLDGTRVPNVSVQVVGSVAEIRNQPVVEAPPVFAEPFSVANWVPIDVGASVVASAAARAVNDCTVPTDSPRELDAIAQ